MKRIELVIHCEDADGETVWWAWSPDVPGFNAGDSTLPALRERAQSALTWFLEQPVEMVERFAEPGELDDELDKAS